MPPYHYIIADREHDWYRYTVHAVGGDVVASGSLMACFAAQTLLDGDCERGLAQWRNLRDLRLVLQTEVAAVRKASNMELG